MSIPLSVFLFYKQPRKPVFFLFLPDCKVCFLNLILNWASLFLIVQCTCCKVPICLLHKKWGNFGFHDVIWLLHRCRHEVQNGFVRRKLKLIKLPIIIPSAFYSLMLFHIYILKASEYFQQFRVRLLQEYGGF